MKMELKIYKSAHNVYVEISGQVILDECERLKNQVVALIDKGINQLYLDFGKVNFIDSAGLGVLVGLKMTASKNKARLILVSPSQNFADILSVAKLDSIFDIIDGAEAQLLQSSLMLPEYLIKPVEEVKPAAKVSFGGVAQPPPLKGDLEAEVKVAGAEAELKATLPPAFESTQELIAQYCKSAIEHIRQGEYEKAVAAYLNAVQLDPEYLPALNNLAIVYEKRPSWLAKAIEQWEKVLEISQKKGDQKHIERARKHLAQLKKLA